MRFLFTLILFSVIPCFASFKIAYIADASLQQSNSAIFNGMKSVAKELSVLHRKKIDITFIPTDSSQKQSQVLSNCYIGGYSAAVIYPIDNSKKLSEKISELSKMGFLIVVLGDNLDAQDALCKITTDSERRIALVENIVKARSKKNTKIVCYFKSEKSSSLSLEDDRGQIVKRLKNFSSIDEFERLFKSRLLEIQMFEFYSDFVSENEINIMRRDSFGEVFFSPELLANMQPIKSDSDREFALCVGSLPILEYYLTTGQITDCVYDDFYGWGVYAVRGILEKKFTSQQVRKSRLLSPLHASKENLKIFVSDWQKWLK